MILYVIENSSRDSLKVGVAENPYERLLQLQTGNPEKLKIIATFEYENREKALKIEKTIHKALGNSRVEGEWFKNITVKQIQRVILSTRI